MTPFSSRQREEDIKDLSNSRIIGKPSSDAFVQSENGPLMVMSYMGGLC